MYPDCGRGIFSNYPRFTDAPFVIPRIRCRLRRLSRLSRIDTEVGWSLSASGAIHSGHRTRIGKSTMTDLKSRQPLTKGRLWPARFHHCTIGLAICLVVTGDRGPTGPLRIEAQPAVSKKPPAGVAPAPAPVVKTAAQREAAIGSALRATIAVDIKDVPLEQAVRDLAGKVAVPVEFDREAIQAEGVSLETRVSLHVPQITLRSALRLLFDEEQLAFLVANEVLFVTTSQKAADILEARLYDVTDLVPHRDTNVLGQDDLRSLANVIMANSVSGRWEEESGPGSIMGLPSAKSQILAIRQTQAVHDEVAEFLADLRKARRQPGDAKQRDVLVRSDQSPAALRESAIRAALDKSVSVAADRQPLHEVLTELARQIDVPIWLDAKRFELEKMTLDTPVTFRCTDISARSALSLMLTRLNLGWVIRHEVLFMTIRQHAMSVMAAHVYDVSDIAVRFRDESGNVSYDLTPLGDAIRTTIEPNSEWGNGAGVIVPYRYEGIVVLTFPQEQYVHEAVAKFLTELRDLRRAQDPDNEIVPYAATKRDRE